MLSQEYLVTGRTYLLLHLHWSQCMEATPPSDHALKRAVAAFGEELAPTLRLNMAARHVRVDRRKYATRKLVKVQNFVCKVSSLVARSFTHFYLVTHSRPFIRVFGHELTIYPSELYTSCPIVNRLVACSFDY